MYCRKEMVKILNSSCWITTGTDSLTEYISGNVEYAPFASGDTFSLSQALLARGSVYKKN